MAAASEARGIVAALRSSSCRFDCVLDSALAASRSRSPSHPDAMSRSRSPSVRRCVPTLSRSRTACDLHLVRNAGAARFRTNARTAVSEEAPMPCHEVGTCACRTAQAEPLAAGLVRSADGATATLFATSSSPPPRALPVDRMGSQVVAADPRRRISPPRAHGLLGPVIPRRFACPSRRAARPRVVAKEPTLNTPRRLPLASAFDFARGAQGLVIANGRIGGRAPAR